MTDKIELRDENCNPPLSVQNIIEVEEELMDLLPSFLLNRYMDCQKIELSLEKRDFKTIKRIGHDLKGVPGAFGYHFLTELGHRIEMAAINEGIAELVSYHSEFREFLKDHQIRVKTSGQFFKPEDFVSFVIL